MFKLKKITFINKQNFKSFDLIFSMENFKKIFNSYFSRTETLKADIQLTQKQILKSISLCCLVRLVLIIENTFAIHFIISITNNLYFLVLLILPLFILLDTVYLCAFRNGREFRWYLQNFLNPKVELKKNYFYFRFSIAKFCFSLPMLTTIWTILAIKLVQRLSILL